MNIQAERSPHLVVDSTPEQTTPRKTRRRKPIELPGQTGLDLPGQTEPDAAADLLEAHRLARIEAGVTEPAWPARSSKRWASMRAGCRKAFDERGVDWCRAMLVWRADEWRRDPGQWAYSTSDVWRPSNLDYAKRYMSGPGTRAGPSAGTLPLPPQLPDRSLPGFTWTPPT